jgi:hypothetical protein
VLASVLLLRKLGPEEESLVASAEARA